MASLNHPYYIEPRTLPESHLELDGSWDLCARDQPAEDPGALPWSWQANLPDSLFWSLHDAGVMPHPYIGVNSKQYHWIDEKVWYYRKRFAVTARQLQRQAILCCDGIAYYARLWLNGILLGDHEGMFGGPVVAVGDKLREGPDNELIIEVKACNWGRKETWDPWNRQGTNREIVPWNLMRDNHTSNGDFIVIGPWRRIRIEFLQRCHISRPHLSTRQLSESEALLKLQLEIADGSIDELAVRQDYDSGTSGYTRAFDQGLSGAVKPNRQVTLRIQIEDKQNGRAVFDETQAIELMDHARSGINPDFYELQFWQREFAIPDPKLWFPNGLGEPNLYRVQLTLSENGALCDVQAFDFGIRTLKLKPSAGNRYRARWDTFQFVVNGKPFFLKGMNWMPLDYLLRLPRERYRWALELARHAGIQLLRVWSGGGIPENDDFYDLCDQLGLMVWQDSFIANMETPNWPQDILQSQVCMNLTRIRNHPSLAVHCGGNEFNAYAMGNAASMFVIQRNIEDLDPGRPFFRTTADRGSAHIYRDMEPTWYRHQYRQLPFLAESGIHSFPNHKSLRQLLSEEEQAKPLANLFEASFREQNPELLNHFTEYVPSRVPRMLSRASHIQDIRGISLPDLAEATQIASYEFYQVMVQAMRANYPVTTGLMPWVFKRHWPTVGIQLVDGLGDPIAPYYALRNAYQPWMVAVEADHLSVAPGETIQLPVAVLSDTAQAVGSATVSLTIFDPQLQKVTDFSWPLPELETGRRAACGTASFTVPQDYLDRYFFLLAEIRQDGRPLARSFYWPCCLARLADPDFRAQFRSQPSPNLTHDTGPWLKDQVEAIQTALRASMITATERDGRLVVELELENNGERPAFPVRIDVAEDKTVSVASDNFFCLLPGEKKPVQLVVNTTEYAGTALTVTATAWNSQPAALTAVRPHASRSLL